tara:strand:- start:4467 stop:6029 length:1563 start_codon:yes stop_codon:yes gene_type:complete
MSRDYRQEYLDFHASRKAKDRRSELNKINHTNGTYGNNDKEDVSHQPDGSTESEDSSTNKGRTEKSREKGSKRKPFRLWSRKKAEQGILLSPKYKMKKSRVRAQKGKRLGHFKVETEEEKSDNTRVDMPKISETPISIIPEPETKTETITPAKETEKKEEYTYNVDIEPRDGIMDSIEDFVTPVYRKITGTQPATHTTEDISLSIPKGEMKFFRNNEAPVGSNYILGGDYMEDSPTAFKASEYPDQMYTTHGKQEDINFDTQMFYGLEDGNIVFKKRSEFKDDDVISPVRNNFGGEYTVEKKDKVPKHLLDNAKKYSELYNTMISKYLETSGLNNPKPYQVESKVLLRMTEDPEYQKFMKEFFKYQYPDEDFQSMSYTGHQDLARSLEDFSSNSDVPMLRDAQGTQLSSNGNKIIIFSPSKNEHLFISNQKEGGRSREMAEFKEKYPDANYLILDNGRFSSYSKNKKGITEEDAVNYMQSSFVDPDQKLGYNFAYKKGGRVNAKYNLRRGSIVRRKAQKG